MSTRLRRLRTIGALVMGVLAAVLLVRAFTDRGEGAGEEVGRSRSGAEEPTLRGMPPVTPPTEEPEEITADPSPPERKAPTQLWRTRQIHGRVVDDEGTGVADVSIEGWAGWRRRTSSVKSPLALSDADGAFEARVAEEWAYVRARRGPGWTASPVAFLPAGAEEVVLRVRRTVTVRGVVLGPKGQPVEGARVKADTRRSTTFAASEPSGPDGRFLLDLPLHVLRVLLWCDAPGPIGGDSRHVWKAEAWIELPHPDEVVLRFVDGVSIEGEVIDHEGRPVLQGRVSVRHADGEHPSWVVGGLEWKAGSFRVTRLAPGPYWVRFERSSFAHATPDPVRVEAPVRGIRIQCPEPHDLSGRVVGEGAHDFVVTYTRSVPGGPSGLHVQEERAQGGVFRFHGMPLADAVLYAYRPGDDRYALLEGARAPDDACALVLVDGLRIEGRLRPPVGGFGTETPKLGVEAPFYRRVEPVQRDGSFVVNGLPEGTWQLYVLHPRYRGHVPLGDPVAAGSTDVVLQYPE